MRSFYKNESAISVEVQKFYGLESWNTKNTYESYETGLAYYFLISVCSLSLEENLD